MTAHIKSGWKPPIGKPLTNTIIARYQREGVYGEHERLKAIARYKAGVTPGHIERCACGSDAVITFKRGKFWCSRCIAVQKALKAKEDKLEQKFNEKIEMEYQ